MTLTFSNRHYLLLCLLVFSTLNYAQSVKGTVLTKEKEPIPYATIQIGADYGVITNDEGRFTIGTKGYQPSDSVAISCLGYEKIGMQLKEFASQEYILKEQVNELSEIYLTDRKLSIDSIMYYVEKNLDKNYRKDHVSYSIFSRETNFTKGKDLDFEITKSTGFKKKQLESFNADFDALEQKILVNKSKQYTDFVGDFHILDKENSKLTVKKAIRLFDATNDQSIDALAKQGQEIITRHLDKDKVYTVKTGILTMSDSVSLDQSNEKFKDTINSPTFKKNHVKSLLSKHGFNEDTNLDFVTEPKKYKYTLEDITFFNSEIVYLISFEPKRGSANYTGKLYVSNETFAVIRADYQFYKGRVGEKLNLKFLLGIKFIEQGNKGSVMFKKSADGFYYPNYIKYDRAMYFYIDRPIKFIENDNRSNKFAFDFKIEGIANDINELLILSGKSLKDSEYNIIKEAENMNYITPKEYDASIWQGFNVLEPLNEMKAFKADN